MDDAYHAHNNENTMRDPVTVQELAKMIDHSLLHPTMTDDDLSKGCELAKKYNVATACIKPYCIPMVRDLLAESGGGVCAVIAFPHGNSATDHHQRTLFVGRDIK